VAYVTNSQHGAYASC